jgi:CubicO group peptidase (beta-lactamase class C family)
MKTQIKTILLVVLIFSFSHIHAVTGFDTTKFINEKRELIKQLIKKNKINGVAVAFFTNDKIIWKECIGKSTYNQSINDSTLFGICSMSKSFTALAVLTAVQSGLVDLDTPIKKYRSWVKSVEIHYI